MAPLEIPLFKPSLGDEEISSLKEIFQSGWVGLGPRVLQFEKEFCDYQGVPYAVAVNSCTAALHLALDSLNLEKGSEVIVPTITFVSTPHAVEYNGLTVVFCDSNEDDLCLDVEDFKAKVTSRTKAVIPVHMGGHPCDMGPVMEIAKQHGLFVIEDVANAQGGEYLGKKLGSIGDLGCFSFEAKKNMTTGDGGMVITRDPMLEKTIRKKRWCGIDKDTYKRHTEKEASSWYYEVDSVGYKYNMNDIAATLGVCQLKKLDIMNRKKRALIKTYVNELGNTGDLSFKNYDLEKGGYWLFIAQTKLRDELFEYLRGQKITCGVHFMPTHMHPYYRKKYHNTWLPKSQEAYRKIISLPLYPSMTESEQEYVIDHVKKFFT